MNIDIRLSLGFFDHPKTLKLQKRCGVEAVLCLQRLWVWAANERSSGVLSGMDEEDIELAAKWTGEEGKFFKALLDCHWIDKGDAGFSLHGWEENQSYASKSEERSKLAKQAAEARWEKERAEREKQNSNADAMRNDADAMRTQCGTYAEIKKGDAPETSIPVNNPPLSTNVDIPPRGAGKKPKETLASVLDEQPTELIPALTEFITHRKSIKKPLTAHALRLNIADLQRLAPNDITRQKEIVEFSIKKGWQGFYLPNEEQYTNASHVPRQGYLSEAERRQQHNDEVCRRVSAELDAMNSPF